MLVDWNYEFNHLSANALFLVQQIPLGTAIFCSATKSMGWSGFCYEFQFLFCQAQNKNLSVKLIVSSVSGSFCPSRQYRGGLLTYLHLGECAERSVPGKWERHRNTHMYLIEYEISWRWTAYLHHARHIQLLLNRRRDSKSLLRCLIRLVQNSHRRRQHVRL